MHMTGLLLISLFLGLGCFTCPESHSYNARDQLEACRFNLITQWKHWRIEIGHCVWRELVAWLQPVTFVIKREACCCFFLLQIIAYTHTDFWFYNILPWEPSECGQWVQCLLKMWNHPEAKWSFENISIFWWLCIDKRRHKQWR